MINFTKKNIELMDCIDKKLKELSSERRELLCIIECDYVHRLDNLKRAYPEESKIFLSHFMYKAYIGTRDYYQRLGTTQEEQK